MLQTSEQKENPNQLISVELDSKNHSNAGVD
jgi:hypothetical protein